MAEGQAPDVRGVPAPPAGSGPPPRPSVSRNPLTDFSIQYGDALWNGPLESPALIEGVLWDQDVVMLLGSEKAGKSILGMQMAFSLTTASPFLDKYLIPIAVPILYIQTEGKPADMTARMEAMRQTLDLDDTKFYHLYKRFLPLDQAEVMAALTAKIDTLPFPPKVIFIDSLYTSMSGDLIDNKATRKLLALLSWLIDRYHVAIVVIHHETKEERDHEHHLVDRGDRGSYGSVFLRAWASHILYLKKHKDKTRTLTCDTQRTGKVMEKEDLILIEPRPLCFEIKEDKTPSTEKVRLALAQAKSGEGKLIEELMQQTSLSRTSIEKSLRVLEKDSVLRKSLGKPRKYWL